LKRRPLTILDSVILGVAGGLAAQVFMLLLNGADFLFLQHLAGYQAPVPPSVSGPAQQIIGPHGLWLVPLVTTLGGLLSGVLVYSFAREAEGDGADTAIRAFHRNGGFIRARVAPLKTVASAITIGSGGSAGREGPTALIAAGVGSLYGTLTHRAPKERRQLVLIGMAAGLSAIFRSPIGTAVFAIEAPYSEMAFEAGALLHTLLASVIAYAVNGLFVGFRPLFGMPASLLVPSTFDYTWYAVLGVASGVLATAVPPLFYWVRDLFHAIPIPPHLKPAIGGLAVGLIAVELPQVLGGGYGWMQQAIDGKLALTLMGVLVAAKLAAFALTLSSGGSGGVFAPTLYLGAMLGGAVAVVLHQPVAPFAVAGMGAVLGGAARVPLATMLMATEMSGGYQFLVPAALAVSLSFFVQGRLSRHLKYRSLYEAQVAEPAYSPAHHLDYIEATVRVLRERPVLQTAGITHMDLPTLLETGLPVDLPNGEQLIVGILKEDSPCVGKPIRAHCLAEGRTDVDTVAILRGDDILLPHSDATFEAGDELLVITSAEGREHLKKHLEPTVRRPGSVDATGAIL
jgi:CIC family chloride channel protein